MDDADRHPSALVAEVAEQFAAIAPGRVVDACIGHGGHAQALLQCGHDVLGLDADPRALEHCRLRLQAWLDGPGGRREPSVGPGRRRRPGLFLRHGRFSDLPRHLEAVGWPTVDGLFADLGVRLDQILDPGSSFTGEGQPDMRLDPGSGGPAALDLLLSLDGKALVRLFREGGVRSARSIAARILAARARGGLEGIDSKALGRLLGERGQGRRHRATKPFLALRRAVNREGAELTALLDSAPRLVAHGGVIAIIAWHGGEDAPVKGAFTKWAGMGLGEASTPKPVRPAAAELGANPRARSARLRAFRIRSPQEGAP